ASRELVELLVAAPEQLDPRLRRVVGGDEPRKHGEAARLDHVIVVALAKRRAAHLRNRQEAAVDAELERHGLERDHAVDDALDVSILPGRTVIEEQHGAIARAEVVLEAEDLAAVAQRAL